MRHSRRAAQLEPLNVSHLLNLGHLLRRRADLAPDAERPPLLRESEEWYAKAQLLDAGQSAAILGCATVLSHLSLLQEGEPAMRIWQRAKQLFADAERSHPEEVEVYLSHGNALLTRAQIMQEIELWESGEQVFRRAVKQAEATGLKFAGAHVGIAYALEGRASQCPNEQERVRLLFLALSEVLHGEKLQPKTIDAAIVLGRITMLLIGHVDAVQQLEFLKAACAGCERVVPATTSGRLSGVWGSLLTEIASRSDETTQDALFNAALEKFVQSEREEDSQSSLLNRAAIYLNWAQRGTRPNAMLRLDRAEEMLRQAAIIVDDPTTTCGLIEVRIVRALLAETGINEAELTAAQAGLDRLLDAETQSGMVHYLAGRIRMICATHLPEPRASDQMALARKHLERAEQLEPKITGGPIVFHNTRHWKSIRLHSPPSLIATPSDVATASDEPTTNVIEGTALESGSSKV